MGYFLASAVRSWASRIARVTEVRCLCNRYRISVSGVLGEVGREVLADLKIECDGADTVLTGDLDEAALYGVLNRLLVLGLELVELKRSPAPDGLTRGE